MSWVLCMGKAYDRSSVVNPDPCVFGPPGSGPGPVIICADPDWFRIQILPSPSKNSKKTLHFYCTGIVNLYDFFIYQEWFKCTLKKVKSKKMYFCCHLEGHWRKDQDPDPEQDPHNNPYQNTTDPHSTTLGKNILKTSKSCSRTRVLLLGYILAGWLRLHYQVGDQVLRIGLHNNNKMS